MKIIDIQQNTPEWYEYRRTRIGASDFNTFCKFKGLYIPYYKGKEDDTLENHFYNKINNVWVDNPFMARGRELEPLLLEEYNKLTGGCYVPTVGQYDGNPDIFASFDGYDVFIDRIVEIKTTAKHPKDEIILLNSYMFQCLHQMKCADEYKMVITINYYNYGITKHYSIRYDVERSSQYEIYFLENKLLSIPDVYWEDLCEEYLQLLKGKINANQL